MRDWNIFLFPVSFALSRGVNWTCEGLKPEQSFKEMWTAQGVNWTCEGLKLSLRNKLRQGLAEVWIEPVRDWNSFEMNSSKRAIEVWIEPVRDWNTNPQSTTPNPQARCELNLWGIETFNLNQKLDYKIPVWIEPVRDWNIPKTKIIHKRSESVNWTCEGLKLYIYLI